VADMKRIWLRRVGVPLRRHYRILRTNGSRWGETFSGLPANLQGTLWLLLAAALFSVMATLVKFLGQSYSSYQVAFFRVFPGMILTLPFLLRAGPASFVTKRPALQLIRVCAGAAGLSANFYAMMHLPLADATAISFARALFLVPLAVFVLREVVGMRRGLATLVGFGGVIIILRPTGSVELGALVAVFGAFAIAVAVVTVKILARSDGPATLLFYASVFQTLVLAIPAATHWVTPDLEALSLLIVMGVVGVGAQACFIRAYSVGEATALAPVDYTRLLFAAILGFLVFQDIPDLWTVSGAAIIIASTLYITYREANVGLNHVPEAPLGVGDTPTEKSQKHREDIG